MSVYAVVQKTIEYTPNISIPGEHPLLPHSGVATSAP
jgi:hypothetical protein